ncbi:polysaccharide export protein [Vibrio makurazakiensis]
MYKKLCAILMIIVVGNGACVAETPDSYFLGPGDKISIIVFGEEDLSIEQLNIDVSESFEYPYLGKINTKNKSLSSLQNEIIKGLKGDYLVSPKVNISIVSYRNVYVNGVVNKPGAFEYQPGLTVEKSIALAGGFISKYRRTSGIYITPEGKYKGLNESELSEILKDQEEASLNDQVGPGDTVYTVSSLWR